MTGITGEQAGQRRDARRNHELLVAAAQEVFAEQGVDASLEEIARRAGLGIGTLYRHFATRDALVEAVFERRIGDFVAVAQAAAAEPDGWLALVAFLERTLELQAADRLLKDVLMRYPPGAGRLADVRQEMRRLFEDVLERARAQGRLRSDFTLADLSLLSWSFAPLIDATAEVAPNAWRRHLQWLLDGLRAESATPQVEPPLDEEQLYEAMQALRRQRFGSRRTPVDD
ncbi:MAG TPA: helix-turn-helix domain-containing protein [Gaiellaceae bacterium]